KAPEEKCGQSQGPAEARGHSVAFSQMRSVRRTITENGLILVAVIRDQLAGEGVDHQATHAPILRGSRLNIAVVPRRLYICPALLVQLGTYLFCGYGLIAGDEDVALIGDRN